jgi:endonuclease-3 related protein
MLRRMESQLQSIYHKLNDAYGDLNWWPAESPFEVALGAILTQNTNWRNVEKAIRNLRTANALSVQKIATLAPEELEQLIRPSGYFRQKAERLQLFCRHLLEQHGSIEVLLRQPLTTARNELLGLKGVGPETADSILLYAGEIPSFVVDAYTRRIFVRLGLLNGSENYEKIRALFMYNLPRQAALFNQYHALIVQHAKRHCLTKPQCQDCPLATDCHYLLDQQTGTA